MAGPQVVYNGPDGWSETPFTPQPTEFDTYNPSGTTPAPTPNQPGTGGTGTAQQIDMGAITAAIQAAMQGLQGGIAGQINQGSQQVNNNTNQGFQQTNQNMNQGFQQLNQNSNTNAQNINQNMNTGFNNLGTGIGAGFTGVSDKLGEGFGGLTTGLTDQKNLLNQIGGDLKTQLGNAQTALLQGQTGIGGKLDTIGTNQNTYYGDLSKKAGDLQTSVNGMQSGLTDYYDQYGKNETRQTQANARMETGMQGGFTNLGNKVNQQSAAIQSGIAGLAGNVGGGQIQAQTNQVAPTGYAAAARSIATGAQATSENDIMARQQFVARLNVARQNPQLAEVTNAFDQNGRLVANQIDPMGNRIARAIDQQGNLVTARLGPDGRIQAQNAVSLEEALAQTQQLPYQTR